MSSVYSAAKAFLKFPGKSSEQVWEELTAVFDPNARNPMSFIISNYPLECYYRRDPNDISLGDIFKYDGYLPGSRTYIHIVECIPCKSFAYDEKSSPLSEEGNYSKSRMDFLLRTISREIAVEVKRRHKGPPLTLREMILTKLGFMDDHGDYAEGLLTRNIHGFKGEVAAVGRDDSLRTNF